MDSTEIAAVLNGSVLVRNLDSRVTEEDLANLFSGVAPPLSIWICRDVPSGYSLGYGYAIFKDLHDAVRAIDLFNLTFMYGKPIYMMMSSQQNPSIRNSRLANVFVKNLDRSIDDTALFDTFSTIGTVLSCKVATDDHGISKGYGYVQFDCEESAQRAIAQLNGKYMNGKQLYVGIFVPRQERAAEPKFTNVYVKNISESLDDEGLKELFSPFGSITSAVVMRDLDGKSKGFGFVNFQIPDQAVEAIEKMNGVIHDDKELFVCRAQKKVDREAELSKERLARANLYFKNLDENVVKNEDNLRDLFSQFGNVISCKLIMTSNGLCKGSGFVAFSTSEEASQALGGLHRTMVGRKPLFLAFAQRKEERQRILEANFEQSRSSHLPPNSPPGGLTHGPATFSIMSHPSVYGCPTVGTWTSPIMSHPPISTQANFMFRQEVPYQQPRQLQQPPLHGNFNFNFNLCRRYIPNGWNGPKPSMVREKIK